jgi:transcriptional activator of cad operon
MAALPAAKPLGDKSAVVLPFIDLSQKHDQAYLSDGLSEELIDRLSREPDLHVPGRTSSFYFKDKRATMAH